MYSCFVCICICVRSKAGRTTCIWWRDERKKVFSHLCGLTDKRGVVLCIGYFRHSILTGRYLKCQLSWCVRAASKIFILCDHEFYGLSLSHFELVLQMLPFDEYIKLKWPQKIFLIKWKTRPSAKMLTQCCVVNICENVREIPTSKIEMALNYNRYISLVYIKITEHGMMPDLRRHPICISHDSMWNSARTIEYMQRKCGSLKCNKIQMQTYASCMPV